MIDEYITYRWLSTHLYYSGNLQVFLRNAVYPFLQQLIHDKKVNQYFFIRYFEKGTHIRLRVKINIEYSDFVKNEIENYFAKYFKLYPSVRNFLTKDNSDEDWYHNDSIQFIHYEPELNRYGGNQLMSFAEQQFYISSKTILNWMKKNDSNDYGVLLGLGIQCYISILYAFGLSKKEIIDFSELNYNAWIGKALYLIEDCSTDIAKEKLEDKFRIQYFQQKDYLTGFISLFWECLTERNNKELEWLAEWLSEHILLFKEYNDYFDKNTLKSDSLSDYPKPILSILDSFIHMTNNRIGILNREEAYIAFLIKESLKDTLI